MKTVRFASLVAKSGRPEAYTLWTAPEKDAHFQSALKAHRVLTVHQESSGGKKDFGEVGFHKGGSLLVFPKSVKSFEGARIVGIKYDLLEPEEEAPAPRAKAAAKKNERAAEKKKRKAEKKKETSPFPPLRVFQPEAEAPEKPGDEQKEEPPAEPEAESEPKHRAKPEHARARDEASEETAALKALQREVKKAMKKLEDGNAVGAYQILERAMGEAAE